VTTAINGNSIEIWLVGVEGEFDLTGKLHADIAQANNRIIDVNFSHFHKVDLLIAKLAAPKVRNKIYSSL
jgi:hypothetical protein